MIYSFKIESQAAYEWHVPLDVTKNSSTPEETEIQFISAYFLQAKSLNEHFYNNKATIIDIKTTKSDLYVIDGKSMFTLSILSNKSLSFFLLYSITNYP